MKTFDRRWRWHLAVGLALTIPLFLFYSAERHAQGACTMRQIYPSLTPDEIRDWHRVSSQSFSRRKPTIRPHSEGISGACSTPPTKRFVEDVGELGPNQRMGAIMQLDILVLPNPNLLNGLPLSGLALPTQARTILDQSVSKRSAADTTLLNRLVLEAWYPGAFLPLTLGEPNRWWYKLGYTTTYALASWLLVFGLLGFFRRHFDHPSPTWRYLADASYWFYLIHIPVIFFIEIPLAGLAIPWPISVPIVGLSTLAILLPSYHFLVRPTFIGMVLNGRSYPIRSKPVRADDRGLS